MNCLACGAATGGGSICFDCENDLDVYDDFELASIVRDDAPIASLFDESEDE